MSKWKYDAIDLYRTITKPIRGVSVRSMKSRGQLPVFVLFYHRVSDEKLNGWTMTRSKFEKQMKWLQANFDIVDLEECQNRIKSGRNDRPTVSVTFYDGYRENGEFANPFLVENNIPATYFVTTDHTLNQKPFEHDVLRNEPLLTDDADSLRAYANAGIEIGAHTRTHPHVGSIQDTHRLVDEVITATKEMEAVIGRSIRYFAFPFGQPTDLHPVVFHLLKECGFLGVCSAYGGWNEIGGDAFHLQRIHGDPVFARLTNALTFDPRVGNVQRYDYAIDPSDNRMLEQLRVALKLANSNEQIIPTLPAIDISAQVSESSRVNQS